jgi:hypothetical protein
LTVELHDAAIAEIDRHAGWYDDAQPGLGGEFLRELDLALTAIASNPRRWSPSPLPSARRRGVRYFRLTRFPFTIAYFSTSSTVYIIAVAHMSRREGYWLGRLRAQ